MIRAAAKNYQDVAVVTSPADYARSSRSCARAADRCPRNALAAGQKAFRTTADYDRAISARLAAIADGRSFCRPTLDIRAPQAHGPALRRKSAPVGGAIRHAGKRGSRARSSCTARSFPTTTWWIWTRPGNWSSEFDAARRGHHQAHQSVRLRRAGHAGRELPQGVRVRSGLGVRRRARRSTATWTRRRRAKSPRRSSKRSPRRITRPRRWPCCGEEKSAPDAGRAGPDGRWS